eukprot:m.481355 g.481355  ORF g.481355 m.481355 type:complete len:384 (+) comp22138_c0_seq1:262-1413(+)
MAAQAVPEPTWGVKPGDPEWIPDSAAKACMRCNQNFSLTFRKHHCRMCGHVVCKKCSNICIVFQDSARLCQRCEDDQKAQGADVKELTDDISSQLSVTQLGDEDEFEDASEGRSRWTAPEHLAAKHCPPNCFPVVAGERWNALRSDEFVRALNSGGAIFNFASRVASSLTEEERRVAAHIVNLTAFEDEARDNLTPQVDMLDNTFASTVTAIMVKATYILPGVKAGDITPEMMASVEYQRSCQPGPPTVWDDCKEPTTMRFTKSIIPYVFKITIQFRVSELGPEDLDALGAIDGVPVHYALLLERTKRNKTYQDGTLKVKSVLLYHDIADGGGVLVTNLTVVLNTKIPTVAAAVLDNLGGFASKEAAETAQKTRAYLTKKLGL